MRTSAYEFGGGKDIIQPIPIAKIRLKNYLYQITTLTSTKSPVTYPHQ